MNSNNSIPHLSIFSDRNVLRRNFRSGHVTESEVGEEQYKQSIR